MAIVLENHLERCSTRGTRANAMLKAACRELADSEWWDVGRWQSGRPVASGENHRAGVANIELRCIAYDDLHPIVLRGETGVLGRVWSAVDLEE